MLARFFIDRPIFGTVVSVIITLTGGIAMVSLPVAQYPQITPPSVSLSLSYPGANAQVVADTIAAPIEQAVNGVEGMLYMSSTSGSDGSYSLSITFEVGTNLNTALVMVQNRVALALPLLPSQVQSQGITVRKKSPDQLMIVSFYSTDPNYIDRDLSNFVLINLKDELLRVDGVSDVGIMGQRDYSIRVWLDPRRLASRGMTAMDVASAVRGQNIQAAAGQTGAPPVSKRQTSQLPIDLLGRLSTPEEFGDIIIKVGPGDTGATAASADTAGGGDSGLSNATIAVPIKGFTPTPAASSSSSSSGSATGASSSGGATSSGGGTSGGGANAVGGATGIRFPSMAASGSSNSLSSDTVTTGGGGGGAGTAPGAGNVLTTIALPTVGAQGPSTSIVRLRDVADVELGAANYSQYSTFDFHTAVGVNVFQLPGTNALDVSNAVKRRIKELEPGFPSWLKYEIGYDTTPFIRESIADVIRTLFEAVFIVGLVVLVFLQDWRAMILPMIDVPVSLVGTFAVMALLGYSLNNISLFGLVLAIGIVVDDAIVVLENIESKMAQGLDARSATIQAMAEITGPILAITLVLCAVFVPCAFIPGITGRFFRQFAVTIAASMVISAINAMTMTPSRALLIFKARDGAAGHGHRAEVLPWWSMGFAGGVLAVWLWPRLAFTGYLGLPELPSGGEETHVPDWLQALAPTTLPTVLTEDTVPTWLYWTIIVLHALPGLAVGLLVGRLVMRRMNALLSWLLTGFNRAFDGLTAFYAWTIRLALRGSALVLLVYLGLVGVTCWAFTRVPTGFIPEMDQGRLMANLQLPDANALELTKAVMARVDKITHDNPNVAHTITNVGSGGGGSASNWASMYVILKPFEERQGPDGTAKATISQLKAAWDREVPQAKVNVNGAAPIPGLSQAGGFKLVVEDIGGLGLPALQQQTETLTAELARLPGLNNVVTNFRPHTPQLLLKVDRDKVEALGVPLSDVNQTLQMYLGSSGVGTFNVFGRHWQVTLQAAGEYRNNVDDVGLLQVRNNKGQMVPLSVLIKLIPQDGPLSLQRYKLHNAASITGNLAQGVSSGEAISNIEATADRKRQPGMGTEWTELMFLQIRAGNTALVVFALAVLCVFLSLAALYESWTMPLAVILVVPMCLLCALAGVWATRDSVNIFVQIGLVVLVGLACKNAILVVEFAQQLHRGGKSRADAAVEASRLRLRPIMMTSFAFILGVVPLVLATGAGSEMRRSLGTAVFSGMIGVTLFGIYLTPVFFYVIQGFDEGPWFRKLPVRKVASLLLGGLLGLAAGFLLAEAGMVRQPWGPLVGAALGVCVVLAVLDARRRWWSE